MTVGTDNVLNNFTFLLRQASDAPVNFRAYVMDWNNAASVATGPVLFQSENLQTTKVGVFETFTINTGNLALVSGNDYVLFFNTSNKYDGQPDIAYIASRNSSNTYAAALSWILNRRLKLDPKKEMFIGDDEANSLRTRPAHDPWRA